MDWNDLTVQATPEEAQEGHVLLRFDGLAAPKDIALGDVLNYVVEREVADAVGPIEAALASTITSGRIGYRTWAEMAADTARPAGSLGEVPVSDAGTHVDPVVGGPAVPNSGVFRWSIAPAGWERLASMPPTAIATNATALAGVNSSEAVVPSALKHVVDTRVGADDGKGAAIPRVATMEASAETTRQALIEAGASMPQDSTTVAAAAYLFTPQFSNPTSRRTITRAGGEITIATTVQQTWGITFEDRDVKGGRQFEGRMKISAIGNSTGWGFGLGITTEAKADAARADAAELTVWESGAAATVTTIGWVIRHTGAIQSVTSPSLGGGSVLGATKIKTQVNNGITFDLNDVILFRGDVPDDAVTDRKIEFWCQPDGTGPFIAMGFMTVAAADWPVDAEVMAVSYSNNAMTSKVISRTVRKLPTAATAPTSAEVAYHINPASAAGGSGSRAAPYRSILEVATASVSNSGRWLKIILKAGVHRLTSGFTVAHDAYDLVWITSEGGGIAELRGTMVPGAWTQEAGTNVWLTANYWGGALSSANGAVIAYDPAALNWGPSAAPGVTAACLKALGTNVPVATMNAGTVPGFSLNTATGQMYVVLPGGESPNAVGQLELVQMDRLINFAGPVSNALTAAPRLVVSNVIFSGGITNVMRASCWDIEGENVMTRGAVSDVAEFRECGGRIDRFRSHGANNDCVKTNLYDPLGGSAERYSDKDRPLLRFDDPEFLGAIVGDALSNHKNGGRTSIRGGTLGYTGKHGASMIEGFVFANTRFIGCADGAITVAFEENAKAEISNVHAEDCKYGLTLSKAVGTAHVMEVNVDGLTVTTPLGLTWRGIYLFNSAAQATMKLNLSNYQCDAAIPLADRRVGFGSATVVERAMALEIAPSLPVAANDAAAAAAGVGIGGLYRNGSDIKVRVA